MPHQPAMISNDLSDFIEEFLQAIRKDFSLTFRIFDDSNSTFNSSLTISA
jgi:hypothetical protein